eukprot:2717861-Pleurochrysis_carterae.AAC.2
MVRRACKKDPDLIKLQIAPKRRIERAVRGPPVDCILGARECKHKRRGHASILSEQHQNLCESIVREKATERQSERGRGREGG